jgi:hypothetical protein
MVGSEQLLQTYKQNSDLTEAKMLMVEHIENNWHQIYEELGRWRGILGIHWDRFKLTRIPGS